ncbi:hypothetical protein AMTRI_Chr04g180980 [Amborella trichopoda]
MKIKYSVFVYAPFTNFGGLICGSPRCNGLGAILTFVAILNDGVFLLLLSWETPHTVFFCLPFIFIFIILYCRHHPFYIFIVSRVFDYIECPFPFHIHTV